MRTGQCNKDLARAGLNHNRLCDVCGPGPCRYERPFPAPGPKVVEIPRTGYAKSNADIADLLRRHANRIEAGEHGDVRYVITIVERVGGGFNRQVLGHEIDAYTLAGVLQFQAIDTLKT